MVHVTNLTPGSECNPNRGVARQRAADGDANGALVHAVEHQVSGKGWIPLFTDTLFPRIGQTPIDDGQYGPCYQSDTPRE
jgi:hypothetical protein